jgi:pimeloyl-ACP methyl ester carboxylesterase
LYLDLSHFLSDVCNQKIEMKLSLLPILCILACSNKLLAAPIDTTENIPINGIQHFISIKGANDENPIILFLHGGPGRSLISFSDVFTKELPNKFIVAQWDQRETGETLKLNPSKDTITIDLLKSDALEVVKHLLKKYQRKKLYLASHSWGSVMGFDIAQKHPELLYAYIPISPLIDAEKSTRHTVEMLRAWAKEIKNDTASAELSKINLPFITKEDLYFSQKWLFVHNEVEGAETPEFTKIFYNWMEVWFPIWLEQSKTSLFSTTKKIKCPIYFFEGRGDNQTSQKVAFDYYQFLKAHDKHFIWFENSGHTIYNSEPQKIEKTLIETVLQETYKKRKNQRPR